MGNILKRLWTIAVLVAGAWAGLELPDCDQRIDLLLHRSIVTHGPLIPLCLFWTLKDVRYSWVRLFVMYVCLGFMVHMAFDLFPARWSGYALISIPLYGRIPAWASVLWLAGTSLLSAYLAARLARRFEEATLLAVGAVAIFVAAAPGERVVVGPLLVVAASLTIGSAARRFRNSEESAGALV